MLSLQKEILGTWGKVRYNFGVSIDWVSVFKSAAADGAITKTESDLNALTSLQDIFY